MKPEIHPDYHEITVKMTNGKTFKTRSTYGKEGGTLQLDVDPTTHPAWTGGTAFVNEKAGRVAQFNEKFGGIKFGKKQKAAPVADAPKADAKKEEQPKVEAPAQEEASKEADAK